jgi:hypothetical protein
MKSKRPSKIEDMGNNYITHSEQIMDWAEGFHWADKPQFQLAIHGVAPKRQRRMEIDLRRLSKAKKLRTVQYGKKLVYALPRKTRKMDEFEIMSKIRHGLACTETLVRFYRARTEGVIIPERLFRGCGSVPEWGIKYPNNNLLLCEFSTKSNFLYTELMNGKINAYTRNLSKIEEKFDAKAVVVFVIDVPRDTVKRYVGSLNGRTARDAARRAEGDSFPLNPFYFTDYQTFLSVPLGQQDTAPIYFWKDGKEYPIRKNV